MTFRNPVSTLLILIGCTMALASILARSAPAQDTDVLQPHAHGMSQTDLAPYIDEARKRFHVPGIAVAVVKDNQVVYEQGFGKRDLGDHLPVDPHTMFCIASITKSFTAMAIEMLADQGKLHLDDRVVDHLPWFRMADPYVTREMRIRDLLAHRSGLSSHEGDLLFVPASTYTTREVVERLRDLPLATGFRSSFAYENIMYAVATLVIEQASGQSYGEFVRDHIFQPIGMAESRIDSTNLKPGDNVATAYMLQENGQLTPIPTLAWKNNQGAAGIYSSVHDMAKWVEVQLASGKLPNDGENSIHRLFSAAGQRRMWSMITPIDIDPPTVTQLQASQPDFLGYAEGWYLSDYRREFTVWHNGEFPGTDSLVTLMPSLHLGVVVLTNQESEDVLSAITFHVLDTYLGAPKTDWMAAFALSAKQEQIRNAEEAAKQDAEEIPSANPSHRLASYAGSFEDKWYGDVVVWLNGGGLRLRFAKSPRLVGSLSPWRNDTFLVRWDDRTLNADALIDFTFDGKGNINGAGIRRASPHTAHAYDYQDLHLVLRRPGTTD
jgi:CubicO group peptidase (beta-lactamase class C family)